jgi:hypothetical protein
MDQVTQGLQDTLGQFEKTVMIADAKSAEEGNRNAEIPVTIRKFKAKQFVKVFEEIDALVQKGVVRITDDAGKLILGTKGVLTEFRDESVLLRGGQPVLNMLAIASGLPQSHVDNLDLLDVAKLFGAGWEVNERFFAQHQTELRAALGPIWTLVEKLFAMAKTTKKTTPEPSSSPSESSPDSSISSSAEDTEPSEK